MMHLAWPAVYLLEEAHRETQVTANFLVVLEHLVLAHPGNLDALGCLRAEKGLGGLANPLPHSLLRTRHSISRPSPGSMSVHRLVTSSLHAV